MSPTRTKSDGPLFVALGILVLAMFSLPSTVYAQSGQIRGRVIDQITREPLPSSNITVLTTTLGASTDPDGRFRIDNVPVGTYQVRSSLIGYEPVVIADVVVSTGKPAELLIMMDQSEIGLETVEVRAGFFQKDPDAPVSVQKLSYEEIRRSPGGFEDVVRAIAVLPGVAQAQQGRNDLIVRGGAPSENLFILDNVEIPNINHFGTQGSGGGPLSYINLDFVRETSFSTGGFGVRYGDRLSSVLDISLREGRTDKVGGKATISASQFGLNVEGPFASNATFVFSARRSYLDFIFKAAGFAFVPEYWDFLGRMHYRIDPSNTISFLGIGAIDDVSFLNDDADQRFDNSRVLGTAQRQYASGFTWEHLFPKGFATLTFGRSYISYNGIQRDSLLQPIFSNRSEEAETGLQGNVTFKLEHGTELSAGLHGKIVRFDTGLLLPAFVTSFGDTLRANVRDYRETGTKGSAYLQVSQHLSHGLQVTVGGRMEYFDLIRKKFSLAPRVSASLSLTELTTLSASAGVYHQSPSYIWLVANPENRSLEAARADQYILGLEHLYRADLRVRVEGFYKKYSNYPASLDRPYLVLANTGAGYGGTEDNFAAFGLDRLNNGGSGRAYGVEFLLQKKLSEVPVYGVASLTLSRSRFTALDGVERPGAFEQTVLFSLTAGYQFDERWEASMKFRFATGQPFTPFGPDGRQVVASYNSARTKSLHSLDIRVDRRWSFSGWSLVTYIDVQNVYNNKFTGTVRWNARERRMESDETSIGILPSIGVSAEL